MNLRVCVYIYIIFFLIFFFFLNDIQSLLDESKCTVKHLQLQDSSLLLSLKFKFITHK